MEENKEVFSCVEGSHSDRYEGYYLPERDVVFSHSGGWSPNWVHSARRPFTGLLYLPRVIVRMENLME
jgi:hypothetical protein